MAKSFQDRIKELDDFKPNITYQNGAFILKLNFNKNWQILEPDGKVVAHSQDKEVPTLHWYASTIDNTDKLFDLIDETIAVNREFEKKSALYKEKVKELQELFLSDLSYEKLKTVQFIFQDKETKPKTKKTANKAQKEDKKEEVKVEQGNTAVDSDNGYTNVESGNISISNVNNSSTDTAYTGEIDSIIAKALGE